MELNKVTQDDGRACAQLLAFLKAGRWELSGKEADVLVSVKTWVASMARQMASQLTAAPADPAPIKVKATGSLAKKRR